MKKTILSLTILSLILGACKQEKNPELSTNLSKLMQQKSVLTKQIDSLNTILKHVEDAISDLDTSKKQQKVTVFTARDTTFNHYISLQGKVSSDQNLILTPEMGGNITRILVSEGQRVGTGQSLVQFDNQTMVNQINELKTQLALATTTFERQERLWIQKIGSEMQYLQAKSQKEALENSIKTLNSQLSKMTLRAPYSGIVDEIFAKKGQMSGSSTPILRLINLSNMYVEADMPETYLKNIKRNTPAILDFVAIDQQIEAKVSDVGNFINPENRSFKIKIDLKNRDRSLKPNLLADLKINDFSAKGIVLPKQIIQMDQQGNSYVFRINRDNNKIYVTKIMITLGEEYNNNVLILDGLNADDELVMEGGKFLKDNDQVLIK